MLRPDPWNIVLILIVATLLFGANRLPEIARSLDQALGGFKEELAGKYETNKREQT